MIRVIVNGAKGKMGQTTVAAVKAAEGLELVAECDLGDDLARLIKSKNAEVVVDFTQPDAAMKNAKIIITSGAHAVMGTTGLTEKDQQQIEKLCKENKVNCLIAPNFAIGAVLMMQFAREAAKHMHKAEIIELHHDKKLDKPSGTAIKTGLMMKESMGEGAEIPIHSVRLPGLVAHQEVIFGGVGQTLTIRHDSISRESFMPGVVLAIRKVMGLKGLVYGLEKVL
ncbi:MAG: 4-hydroxy-tetrahydrodipicolinate reductase [Candidatus Margulisiibacteriota bacterium]